MQRLCARPWRFTMREEKGSRTTLKTIYYNGEVYTGGLPLVQAFAVEDGRFVFAGTDAEAKALAAECDRLVDLKGRFVCSGFNDSHMHVLAYGNTLSHARLEQHTESLSDMIACLKDFASTLPNKKGTWIVGRGWNHDYFTDVSRMPDRRDLDEVSEDLPVCAVRACGHCLVVNSLALKILGITGKSPQPDGGHIGMENGEPDGRLYDNAMQMAYHAIPAPDKDKIKHMLSLAIRSLNSYGVTSSQTDDYCVFRDVPWQTVNEAYRELEAAGELTVRIYEQSNFTDLQSLKGFIEAGNVTGVGTELFKIGPLKMLGDGALGARTAFLSRPYADDPSTCGIPVFSQEDFDTMVGYANAHGMQVAIHTIGDACLDRVLNAYEKALAEHPREDHRHGVIHCQITRADQLERMAKLRLHVYAQSIFLDYDSHIVHERVGDELASTSYSWKTLMDKGVSVSNGTDCPVELPDAMACIQCAVTRASLHGHLEPYLPDQAFTVQEALDSYTIRGAEGSFEENVKGRIAPGFLADFVVLGANPFEVDQNSLKDVPVCATYLGGRQVYKSEG